MASIAELSGLTVLRARQSWVLALGLNHMARSLAVYTSQDGLRLDISFRRLSFQYQLGVGALNARPRAREAATSLDSGAIPCDLAEATLGFEHARRQSICGSSCHPASVSLEGDLTHSTEQILDQIGR
jgi:hypothetical protein